METVPSDSSTKDGVDAEKEDAHSIKQLPALEEAAEDQVSEPQSYDLGFKKVFRFVGFRFTVKKEKTGKSEPVQLLTVKKETQAPEGADDQKEVIPQLLFPTAWASPHTGPDQIPAQLHCLGFGLAAVEVKHGCLCKHLCLLPHYTHKYPFHAQPMEDLFGWVMILAAAPQLALDQDLALGDTVSDLPPISIPGRG